MNTLRLSAVLVSALLSFSALAGPKVGDVSFMEGKYMSGAASIDVSFRQETVSYNVNTDVFVVKTTQTVAGSPSTSEANVASSDMFSEEQAAQIVAACDSGIGATESVTVKAGTYVTCHAKTSSGADLWVAPDPYGLVKVSSPTDDGGSINLELSSYARGSR
jgi:hypothetical protein